MRTVFANTPIEPTVAAVQIGSSTSRRPARCWREGRHLLAYRGPISSVSVFNLIFSVHEDTVSSRWHLRSIGFDFARCSQCARGASKSDIAMDTFMDLLRKNLSDKDFTRMMAFTASMAPERRATLMQFIAERETLAPTVGQDAPDFNLSRLGSTEQVQLSAFRGRKPVALIFGSYT